MAYGNLITDGAQIAIGAYGYIAAFDLSAHRIKALQSVQMQLPAGPTLSDPDDEPQSGLDALMALPSNSACPNFAWYAMGQTVYVFCKTSVYVYSSASRVGFFYYENPEPISAATDEVIEQRLPSEAKELMKALTLKKMYEMQNKQVPLAVNNTIAREKAALGV